MGLEREIWLDHIVANLFKVNPFLQRCQNHDAFVLGGKVVYLPQAGAKPVVRKNRDTSNAATVTKRSDSVTSYVLDEFTTDPVHIPNIDKLQLSYDKRESVIFEHQSTLIEAIAEEMLYSWRPAGAKNLVRTSGEAAGATLEGATGNRLIMTAADLKAAMTILNKQNMTKQGRTALLSSEMFGQLLDDPMLKNRDVAREADYVNGTLARLYGFDIMERSSVLTSDNTATPVVKELTANAATTDNDTALCWAPSAVAAAQGTLEMFERERDPQYFGDIYSFLMMYGGRKMRANGEGVVGIVQKAAA